MLNTSVAPWPSFTNNEIEATARILRSGKVNQWTGEEVKLFEFEFANFTGCNHAIAVANGTLALDLALHGLGICPGDEVIVTPRTFIASISSVVNAGGIPVFAEVDSDSGNVSEQTIQPLINDRTKAIVPVHLAGWPCEMERIMDLANAHDILVIEDCAQAHGAKIDGKSVGSFGHVGAWSFCQDKIISTAGEGGMVTCNDQDLWKRMWAFKDHGKSWEAVFERKHPPGFRWLHESFGTNLRMTEISAAIGRIQLCKLDSWTERRQAIAHQYAQSLFPYQSVLRAPLPREGFTHAYYRFYAYVRPEALKSGWTRDRIVAEATEAGIPLFQGSCSEVYREGAFSNTSWAPTEALPIAKELGETSLMLLTHPTLTDANVEMVCDKLCGILDRARI